MQTPKKSTAVPEKAIHWHVTDDAEFSGCGQRLRSLLARDEQTANFLLCVTGSQNPEAAHDALGSFLPDNWCIASTAIDRESTADGSAILWLTLARVGATAQAPADTPSAVLRRKTT